MDNCIFCKIVDGKIPSHKVYEDDSYLAFLDIHPQSPGHTQVIPKEHRRWVWDVPRIGTYFEVVQKMAKAQQKAFGVEAIWSKVMGDEVPHAHVWVFPNPALAQDDANDFPGNAKKISEALKGD